MNDLGIQCYFSQANGEPDKELISLIKTSKTSLDVAIYSITKKEIVDSIINAKKRAVDVRIITDRQEMKNKSQEKELLLLKAEGIPIKFNLHSGLMHLKLSIVDRSIVTTGSYNYTEAATKNNDEVLVIIDDQKIAQDFEEQFLRMWNDKSNFSDY